MFEPGLDLFTMMLADVFVTAVLGVMLTFAWLQSRSSAALGWWGGAHLLQSVALVLLVAADAGRSLTLLKIATALLLASYGLIWVGARCFDGRRVYPPVMLGGAMLWIAITTIAPSKSIIHYFAIYSLINAAYCFLIAGEFWRGRVEPLVSRWPAIVLMSVSGAGFLSWIPITFAMPHSFAGLAFPGAWFAALIMVTMLGKVAFAFIMLAMAKERLELRQLNEAMTDPLTGLPNRRGFFRQALRRIRQRNESGEALSVLLFDLDHFKSINDRYGHGHGDRVLSIFADVLHERIKASDVVGRVGGEEFAAFLPGANAVQAAEAAERVRVAFQSQAAVVDGATLNATVSVGVVGVGSADCSLHLLLARADSALYSAKAAGRNCVRTIELTGCAQDDDVAGTIVAPPIVPAANPIAVRKRARA